MRKSENICPKCDALMGEFCELREKVMAPYGTVKDYIEKVSTCDECGYEVSNDVDASIYRALYEKSVAESIPAILNSLNQFGYSMVATERILELPFRTLSRWKTSGKPSAGGVALLRLLATFPWLLQIADNNYEDEFTENLLIVEAAKALNKKISSNDITCKSEIASSNDSATIVLNLYKNQTSAPSISDNFSFETYEEPATLALIQTTGV